MSTAAAAAEQGRAEAAAPPVLGELMVGTRHGGRVLRWTTGTPALARGLTTLGIAAAAVATGRYLAGLEGAARAEAAHCPRVRISVHEWEIPLVRAHVMAVAAMMRDVVNMPGAVGELPS